MMRRAVAFVFVLLILSSVFLLPVCAENSDPFSGISMSFPEGYKKLTRSNLSRNKSLVAMIGYTPATLKNHMVKENIYYIGVGEDVDGEFHIKSWENEYSKKAKSFVGFDDAGLAEINQNLFGGNAEICKIGNKDTIYYRTKSKVMEADFHTYQYTTIENGKFYSFIYYGNSSAEIDALMATVRFNKSAPPPSVSTIIVAVIMGLCIIIGVVAMGVIAVGVVRDIRNKPTEAEQEDTQHIRIKRRKM